MPVAAAVIQCLGRSPAISRSADSRSIDGRNGAVDRGRGPRDRSSRGVLWAVSVTEVLALESAWVTLPPEINEPEQLAALGAVPAAYRQTPVRYMVWRAWPASNEGGKTYSTAFHKPTW